ncbi:hypothetical protein [Streptomyces sp. MBT53]|uniref:hypothetical protein n=1 Tax=Streptomyces sp. MBT53 TaxID=1488384 RepID=UPI0019118B70|nr:hypothetical protein [Streptomyces sp. MBT53]MBK6018516.1 hypothetical protein [Streptomyces sp. MBT53]
MSEYLGFSPQGFEPLSVTRTSQYVVRMQNGDNRGCLVQFTASDQVLSNGQLELIRSGMNSTLSTEIDPLGDVIDEYTSVCARVAGASDWALRRFLLGEDAILPRYGSPPQGWMTLERVVTHAAGVFTAIGVGGGVPTLLLAYSGGVVLVHFVNPIVQEAGRAVAEGVGARIRMAFGLASVPSVGAELPPLEDTESLESGDGNREES